MNERERAEDEREDEEIQQRIREMHEEEEEDSRELEMIFEVQDLEGGRSVPDQPANLVVLVELPDGTRVEKGFRRFDTGREASQFLKELIEDTCRRYHMSELKEGRIPEINDFGEDLHGKTWVESSDFEIEFWLDYNGFWEPESVKALGEPKLCMYRLVEEFEELTKALASTRPEVFFDPTGKALVGVTRLRLIGKLATCWDQFDPTVFQHTFTRKKFLVLERARFPVIY